MANPFLFGDPVPNPNEPPNPFLGMGQASAAAPNMAAGMAPNMAVAAANPFMTAQPVQAGGFFGGQAQTTAAPPPPMAGDAANPFASFGAPNAFQAPYNNLPQQQQPPPPPQNQQQCQGQFGQYTQVMADSTGSGQPEVTSSFTQQAAPPAAAPVVASNPFAQATSDPVVVPSKVMEPPSLPSPPPPAPETVVSPVVAATIDE